MRSPWFPLCLLAAACSGTTAPPPDAGPADAGPPVDAGPPPVAFQSFVVSPLALYNLAIDAQGRVWAASELNGADGSAAVYRFDPTTREAVTFPVADGTKASAVAGGLAIDGLGNVWLSTAPLTAGGVIDPAYALVQLESDGSVLQRILNQQESPAGCTAKPCAINPLYHPTSIAIDAANQIWFADRYEVGGPFLTQLDGSGPFLRSTAIPGANAPYVQQLAIDAQGAAWAIDPDDNALVQVTAAGVERSLPLPASLQDNTLRLTIDRAGDLWLAATGNQGPGALVKLDASGAVLGTFDIPDAGSADGIATDHAGTLWIADNTNLAVVGFDSAGQVVARYSPMPSAATASIGRNMAVDPSGNLWITSSAQQGTEGTLLELPGIAAGPESFPFAGPVFPY